jgi:hypothetical protein
MYVCMYVIWCVYVKIDYWFKGAAWDCVHFAWGGGVDQLEELRVCLHVSICTDMCVWCIYIYVCVCMYVCICVCVCESRLLIWRSCLGLCPFRLRGKSRSARRAACMFACEHMHRYVCMVYMYVCMYVTWCVYVKIDYWFKGAAWDCVHFAWGGRIDQLEELRVCLHVSICTDMCVWCIYMYVCMYLYVCMWK